MSLPSPKVLSPLPYHEALAAYLQAAEPETWKWFESAQAQADYADALRLELLKQTYRLDPAAHPEPHAALAEAAQALELGSVPATLYQSQTNQQLGAALFFLPGELHVVLEGNVLQLLDARELRGVLGHELAHYRLWSEAHQRLLVLDRAVHAMAASPQAEASHVETARLLRLYTEIYADRGALQVLNDPLPVISGLVKMHTGLAQADAASYVRQAEEVFARDRVKTDGLTHPEAFIRARAVALWAADAPGVDAEITRMIEGPATLERLGLLGQNRLASVTRRWLHALFAAPALHSDSMRAHARLFFDDFAAARSEEDGALVSELAEVDASVRDYLCYVLLDFAAIDPELDDAPLREGFRVAGRMGWADRLESLAVRELKWKKRDVQRARAGALEEKGPPA